MRHEALGMRHWALRALGTEGPGHRGTRHVAGAPYCLVPNANCLLISYPATARHNTATPKQTTKPMTRGIAVANAAHFTLPVSL